MFEPSVVRHFRDLHQYPQRYIACKLGISQAAYAKKESGKTPFTVDKLLQVATILEVPAAELIDHSSHSDNLSLNSSFHTHVG